MAKSPTFEQALAELEECADRLEQGDLPIDEALRLFERGVKNVQRCRKALTQVENKVERLMTNSAGDITTSALHLP